MPFIFTIFAILFIVIGARGQSSTAIALLKSEFTGPNSFIQFLIAILVVGFLGYLKPLKLISDGFLLLILISMFLANKGGFFAQFENALQNTPATTTSNTSASSGSTTGTSSLLNSLLGTPSTTVTQTPTTSNTNSGVSPIASVQQTLLTPYAPTYDTTSTTSN
jgi:hypothetical protein